MLYQQNLHLFIQELRIALSNIDKEIHYYVHKQLIRLNKYVIQFTFFFFFKKKVLIGVKDFCHRNQKKGKRRQPQYQYPSKGHSHDIDQN